MRYPKIYYLNNLPFSSAGEYLETLFVVLDLLLFADPSRRMAERGMITEEERRQLSQGNGGKTNPGLLEWLMGYEQMFTKLIPTPRASDYKGAASNRFYSQNVQVERERETERVPQSALRTCGSHAAWDPWPTEPGMDRVADGIPNRVDRIKCLGNAVVPQQAYPFFSFIAEIERRNQ